MTAAIQKALNSLDQAFADDTAEKFGILIDELERWNRKINLTAIRGKKDMITSHLLDSVVAAPFIIGKSVLDVGTGPGFPGLPLAIVQPERHFTLLDSNNKKIMFVEHVARLLGLDNVIVIQSRVEDYAPGHGFDTVIVRALASLPRLMEIAGHHVREDGVFVALKGRYPEEELEQLNQLRLLWRHAVIELNVPGLEEESRHAVLLRR
ncbi:MAG: 16S rRNA (guanine(527)-N(7))-methyltransferase RsmG [Woeseiaceae bacterium]|nr:16S rRNA (guanine(527)-N(7))-methyltransferase RsmG [Woeseiaceae bacterium]